MDFVDSVVQLDKSGDFSVQFVDIVVDVAVFLSLDGVAGNNGATGVNNAENGVGSTDVNAENVGFHF